MQLIGMLYLSRMRRVAVSLRAEVLPAFLAAPHGPGTFRDMG